MSEFNPPPGWPRPPRGWRPPEGWSPDPSWPAAPRGWDFWGANSGVAAGRASRDQTAASSDLAPDWYAAQSTRVGHMSPDRSRARSPIWWIVAAGIAVALLCVGIITQFPSRSDTETQSYKSALELRDAAVESGYSCPEWSYVGFLAGIDSGNCSDETLLQVYVTKKVKDEMMSQRASREGDSPALVGENWMVVGPNSFELESLQRSLGGEIVED